MYPEDITLPYGNERFWAKVEFNGPDGCWLWTASVDDWGYGVFWYYNKPQKAHRIIYEAVYGRIPDDLLVCHTCDDPSCVNPTHLFVGTNKDNSDDKWRKGRAVHVAHSFGDDHWTHRNPGASPVIGKRGEANHAAKFTEDDIRAIRRRYAEGDISQLNLAKEYGTEQAFIGQIINRKRWAHVEDPDAPPAQPRVFASRQGEACGHAKITADIVREIRMRYAAGGISMKALGSESGMSAASVCLMVKRQTWQNVD